ncbi:MAG: hypothetical protein AAGD04_08915 [Pseudomonadota bacterium]
MPLAFIATSAMVLCDMKKISGNLKSNLAALLLSVGFSIPLAVPVSAQSASPPGDPGKIASILERLKESTPQSYAVIERELELEWSKSGSASMNLLLQRGKDALERGEFQKAFFHFSALIDHAPEFAEGYAGRATALFRMDRVGQALADIEEALRRNPNHYPSMIGFGIIMAELGNPHAAVAALKRAASIHPHREDVTKALDRLVKEVEGTAI